MIKKIIFLVFILASTCFGEIKTDKEIRSIYQKLHIKDKLKYSIFYKAMKGYNRILNKKEGIITIIDFTKPSNEERFFVINLNSKHIDYLTYVTHGKNSGFVRPVRFSNTFNSLQSSIGFFVTSSTYKGSNGYSLKLMGLEPGINSNALKRHIVVHGAPYATKEWIDKCGFLGRSLGCPAIPEDISTEVIDEIKDGTVFFINADDPFYVKNTKI